MSVIFTRAPLRLSLGGGGTDLPSYYREHGGFLVGAAMDKYMYMLTHTVFQKRYRLKYSQFEEVDDPSDIKHPILREALVRHWDGNPLEIASLADIPAGTGLGSSGAFAVCLLKALALAGSKATTPSAIAEAASHIEIDVLGEPVGKQDTYVSAHGGICAYTFHHDDTVSVEPLELSEDTIQGMTDRFLLFFTGETRDAVEILADQDERSRAGDAEMIQNLHRTKEIGLESRKLLESGELEQYAELMHEHWLNKRKRSAGMTTDRADELYELARKSGAIGGKLVGAGGGGFLLMYTTDVDATRAALGEAGAAEVRFGFDFHGCVGTEYR
jgi:D-glycero-alpha-D-manno-heptose-7-phosphate kinase